MRKSACAQEHRCSRSRSSLRWRRAPRRRRRTWPPRRGPSLNLYGVTGLIDMPSAEAQPDAQVSASYSQFGNTAAAQLHLPGAAAGVGDAALLDDQRTSAQPDDPDYDLFDRSLDLQFQLWKEKGWQPSVALGFRDLLGTGIYSAEYLVATKQLGARSS